MVLLNAALIRSCELGRATIGQCRRMRQRFNLKHSKAQRRLWTLVIPLASASNSLLMVAILLEDDWATKYALPIGQWMGLAQTDPGNYAPFWTHSLEKSRCGKAVGQPLTEVYETTALCMRRLDAPTRMICSGNAIRLWWRERVRSHPKSR